MDYRLALSAPVVSLRISIEAVDDVSPPAYLGSALRGLFGHGLRKLACVNPKVDCKDCPLLATCVYSRVFLSEGGPLAGDAAPTRYVVAPPPRSPASLRKGEGLDFEMILIRLRAEDMPFIIQAWCCAAERGLGPNNCRFQIRSIHQEHPVGSDQWRRIYGAMGRPASVAASPIPLPPPPSEPIVINLVTPARLKRNGKLVRPEAFDAPMFLSALHYRAIELCGGPRTQPRYETSVHMDQEQLRWSDWTRYSSRQKTRMQLGGVTGRFVLSGEGLAEHWPVLWRGQWWHIGKTTSMGLGRYRIEAASLPAAG